MSIAQNKEIRKINELVEKIKKEKKQYREESKARKMLYKKGLNPLIEEPFITTTIYKEFKATFSFTPQTKEELVSILKTFNANLYLQTERANHEGVKCLPIRKNEQCKPNYIKLNPYTFHISKCSNYQPKIVMKWLYKERKNIYLFSVDISKLYLFANYEPTFESLYNNQRIQKGCNLIINHPNISRLYKRIKFVSYSREAWNDYKLYSDFTFTSIYDILELNDTQTIDDLFASNSLLWLQNNPKMLSAYLLFNERTKHLHFDVYDAKGFIYLKTSKGTLYVDTIAFLNQDVKTIIKKHLKYWKENTNNDKEELKKQALKLATEEAKELLTILLEKRL